MSSSRSVSSRRSTSSSRLPSLGTTVVGVALMTASNPSAAPRNGESGCRCRNRSTTVAATAPFPHEGPGVIRLGEHFQKGDKVRDCRRVFAQPFLEFQAQHMHAHGRALEAAFGRDLQHGPAQAPSGIEFAERGAQAQPRARHRFRLAPTLSSQVDATRIRIRQRAGGPGLPRIVYAPYVDKKGYAQRYQMPLKRRISGMQRARPQVVQQRERAVRPAGRLREFQRDVGRCEMRRELRAPMHLPGQ